MSDCYEFDEAFQNKIAALILRDTAFCQRTDGLIKPEYFSTEPVAYCVDMGLRYFNTYKKPPHISILKTLLTESLQLKRFRKDMLGEIVATFNSLYSVDIGDRDFAIDKVVEFAKHQAVKQCLLECVELLEKNDLKKIADKFQGAINVGAVETVDDYDYWEEIENRTKRRVLINDQQLKTGITTGWSDLDDLLYHGGWGRKELSILMGGPKVGKSLALAEFARNASLAGYMVLFVTLEVSRDIVSDRLDSALSDVAFKSMKMSPHLVESKIKQLRERAQTIRIREYAPDEFKPSTLRRLLENYRSKSVVFDLIVIDYADLMDSDRVYEKDTQKYCDIYRKLRAVASNYDASLLSATQTNRQGAKSTVAEMTDVAEDFNKIRIADLTISINADSNEKLNNEARLYFAAARNDKDGMMIKIRQDREKTKFIKEIISR